MTLSDPQLRHYAHQLRERPDHRKRQHYLERLCQGWNPSACTGETNHLVIDILRGLLESSDVLFRRKAVQALGLAGTALELDAATGRAVPRAVADRDPSVRIQAAGTTFHLSMSGWRPGDAQPLHGALADPVYTVRWFAAGSLVLQRRDASSVHVLIDSAPPTRNHRWLMVVWHVIQAQPTAYDQLLPTFDRLASARDPDDFDWQDWKERVTLRARRIARFGHDFSSGDRNSWD